MMSHHRPNSKCHDLESNQQSRDQMSKFVDKCRNQKPEAIGGQHDTERGEPILKGNK